MIKGKKRGSALMSSKVLPLIVIMVVVVVFFQLMNPGYLGQRNILIMFKSMSLVGILGVGISMLLLSGEIDLATSAEATLSGVLVGILLSRGVPWLLAVLITLAGGAIMGAVNALLVNGLNMMSFIATIGISSVWSGVSMLITRGSPVKFSSNSGFVKMGSISVLGIFPVAFIVMIALLLVYGLILSQTKFGRSIYMCGGNRGAARLAGINPKKVHSILFVNCGIISSLGGILLTANMRKGDPAPLTQGMDAVTAAILGGVSFTGGSGGMFGLFVGLMLLNFFNNGLTVVQLQSFWRIVAQGLLLILALTFDYYRENQRLKALKAGAAEISASKQQ